MSNLTGIIAASTRPSPTVVVDATALDTGHAARGIGRYVRGLVEGLTREEITADFDAPMVALRLETPRAPVVAGMPGAATALAKPLAQWHLKRPSAQHRVRWVFNEALLAGELRAKNCALFHATEPWGVPVSARFATVLTCHDLIPLLFADQYLNFAHYYWRAYYAWMQRTKRWSSVERIIAISQATRTSLIEELGVDPSRIDIVYNGIDHGFFKPVLNPARLATVRERYDLKRPFILYLGGYDYRKNIKALVEAMAFVPGARDVELVLAGGMDAQSARQFEAIAAQQPATRLRRLGYIADADIPALYSMAALFCYPSLAEGFGLQALEAMACGCPVVSSDRTSLPEVIGDAGLLADPESPEALGHQISRVLEDPALAERLRVAGLARAAEFSWERCARETLDVYRRAL